MAEMTLDGVTYKVTINATAMVKNPEDKEEDNGESAEN